MASVKTPLSKLLSSIVFFFFLLSHEKSSDLKIQTKTNKNTRAKMEKHPS